MTVHWITPDLIRKSAALACGRFTGSHTFDRIAEINNECLVQFDLDTGKVVSTVTDNASNFKKAFIEFRANNEDSDSSADEVEEDEMTYLNVDQILQSQADCDNEAVLIQLPRHEKCVCHTLNLVATTDAEKAIHGTVYGRMCHASFGKCQAI